MHITLVIKAWKKKTINLQSWTKVLGPFCVSGAFSNSHRSKPSPHPTNKVGLVYPEFFFWVSTLYRVGEGEVQENFENDALFKEGTEKWHKNMPIAILSQGLFIDSFVVSALQDAGGYVISRQNNLELHLGYHTCWLSYFTLVYLWCGRTVSRAGGVRSRDYQIFWDG